MICCGGRDDAHFHWCWKVGGCGCKPGTRAHVDLLARAGRSVARAEVRPVADPHRKAQATALNALVGTGSPQKPAGVTIVSSPEPARAPAVRVVAGLGDPDPAWEADVDRVMGSALRMRELCDKGLPGHVPFSVHDAVTTLDGYDDDRVRATLSRPSYVEIRPESAEKKYPILGFHRGDVHVVVGLRDPNLPVVIACYWMGLLGHDAHRVNRSGGGGSKAANGLPGTAELVVKRLTAMGCAFGPEPVGGQGARSVSYRGQDLGKVTWGPGVKRDQCHTDFQRTQRKVAAIQRRDAASA